MTCLGFFFFSMQKILKKKTVNRKISINDNKINRLKTIFKQNQFNFRLSSIDSFSHKLVQLWKKLIVYR